MKDNNFSKEYQIYKNVKNGEIHIAINKDFLQKQLKYLDKNFSKQNTINYYNLIGHFRPYTLETVFSDLDFRRIFKESIIEGFDKLLKQY